MYFFSASYGSILPHPIGHSDKPEGKIICVQDSLLQSSLHHDYEKSLCAFAVVSSEPEKVGSETALKYTPLGS